MKKLILLAAALASLGCGSTCQFGREQGQLGPDEVAAKFSQGRNARMSLWSKFSPPPVMQTQPIQFRKWNS
jgi:hypothetical protein